MRAKRIVPDAQPVRTAKIKLLKGVVLGPEQRGKKGEIFEVPRHFATELVSFGMAEETEDGDPLEHDETPAEEKDGYSTVTIEKPTVRDPKPSKRG
jgi:hypothetical protein